MNRRNFLKRLLGSTTMLVFPTIVLSEPEEDWHQAFWDDGLPSNINVTDVEEKEDIILKLSYSWLGSGRFVITREDNVNKYIKLEITDDKAIRSMDFTNSTEYSLCVDVRTMIMKVNGKIVDFMQLYNKEHSYGQCFTTVINVDKL